MKKTFVKAICLLIISFISCSIPQISSAATPDKSYTSNGEIIVTFDLPPQDINGLDPSTLVIYGQREDGSILELGGEYDWEAGTISVITSYPGNYKYYIIGREGVPAERLYGANRYATAAKISQKGWAVSDNVILTSGDNFPDALAGTVLAFAKNAPILLTDREELSTETLSEIKRLQAKHIYMLGGTSVISQDIEDFLAEDYLTTRIYGSDRYETASKIGQLILDESNENTFDTVILTTGANYADALAIAPFAANNNTPILFSACNNLNETSQQALETWGAKEVTIVGGIGAISQKTEDFLQEQMNLKVTRLSGDDRYLTSLAIAQYFNTQTQINDSSDQKTRAALATGDNFPDALAGGPFAAKQTMPLLLISKDKVAPEIKTYLKSINLEKIYVYGGETVISEHAKNEVSLEE